jgi:type III restriction enzyme
MTSWEKRALRDAAEDPGYIGWLRNPVRKEWSLAIPYEETGIPAMMYPDFLIFRSEKKAGVFVDILEPHASNQADLAPKLAGLCKYAGLHGDHFGRIALLLMIGKQLIPIDVNDPDIRSEARLLTENKQVVNYAKKLASNGG